MPASKEDMHPQDPSPEELCRQAAARLGVTFPKFAPNLTPAQREAALNDWRASLTVKWKAAAKQYHPDRPGGDAEKFKTFKADYDLLMGLQLQSEDEAEDWEDDDEEEEELPPYNPWHDGPIPKRSNGPSGSGGPSSPNVKPDPRRWAPRVRTSRDGGYHVDVGKVAFHLSPEDLATFNRIRAEVEGHAKDVFVSAQVQARQHLEKEAVKLGTSLVDTVMAQGIEALFGRPKKKRRSRTTTLG